MPMMWSRLEFAVTCAANLAYAYAFFNIFDKLLDQNQAGRTAEGKLRAAACYLVFCFVNSYAGLAHIHGLPKAAVVLLSLFFCALFAHRGQPKHKAAVCLASGGYAVLVEMLSVYISAFICRSIPGNMENREMHGVFVMVLSRAVLLCSSFGASAAADRLGSGLKSMRGMGMLLIIPLFSALLVLCMLLDNVPGNRFADYLHNYVVGFCLLTIIITNLGLIFLLNRVYQQNLDREKLKHLEQQKRLYMETMEIQRQSQTEIEKYRHDVKNLYLGLDNCIKTGRYEEAREMLKKELDIVYRSRQVMNTGNLDLDCLLNHKISLALSKGIALETQVKLKEPIQIEMRELYIIVGNMLDNAIEAVQKLPGGGKIKFYLESGKGVLFIKESNEFEGNLIKKGDGFATTKAESEKHGYGISNMEEAVKRYNGKLDLYTEGREFTAEVCIFYKEK